MRFKDVFSIIGPSMVGPSSSHTAGAVRIGRTARRLFGPCPERAEMTLYGSFAETYRGHGTDLALVAGLLDFGADDARIRDALRLAEESGLQCTFKTGHKAGVHPNTVGLRLTGGNREDSVLGCSIGGGSIEITAVNGFDVRFSAQSPTLLVFHADRPGMVADMTDILRSEGVNIGCMDVDRKSRQGDALTVIETDETIAPETVERLKDLTYVRRVGVIDIRR